MTRAMVLTGGIGSGKSEVARALAARGAHVVDADVLARRVVEPGTPGLAAVIAEFGPEVVAPDGSLDRAALADLVFGQADRLAALEAIIHPRVEALAAEELAAGGDAPVLVYEVPLLRPEDTIPPFPSEATVEGVPVVVVDAPDELRRERLLARGLPDHQVTARMASQPSRAEWRARADRVLDNAGDLDALERQVDDLWGWLTAPTAPVSRPG
ncbi:MAG TPA: dephospho-CoA kinase [Actinomycetes bacterium]|nr:dephospho-CoA kinase [Actinomycetes bacterium]